MTITLEPAALPRLCDFKPETIRGSAGFFRVGQTHKGVWWLLDPDDQAFFASAVQGEGAGELGEARLRAWNFNTRVTRPRDEGRNHTSLPYLPTAGLSDTGPWVRTGGARLPDVFDHSWVGLARARAEEVCGRRAHETAIVGWKTDEALDWAWSGLDGRPTLLQLCLSLEPRFAAYHAAWEFVLALHEGSFEKTAADWQVPLTNKEMLRAWTLEEKGFATEGYRKDHRLWSEQFAHRYFSLCAQILRSAAPHHLRFSPPSGRLPEPIWLSEQAALCLDVGVTTWTPDVHPSRNEGGPRWIDGFTWADPRIYAASPIDGESADLTRVERMLVRGRKHYSLLLADPATVGWSWANDVHTLLAEREFEPRLLRADGSDAIEHTDLLTALNAGAWARRAHLR